MSESVRDIIFEAMEASLEAQLGAIRRLRNRSIEETKPKRTRGTSQIVMVEHVLKEAEQPLHLSVIIERVRARFGVELDPDSIGSALTKRVVKKEIFTRPARNTFAILESKDAG